MEDNIAKLLQIAGGVLLGVILLSLVSNFFSSIGILPSVEDERETAEQLSKFNLEYEIYDKKGMYGVDVISCLNKANSNNKKYVSGNSFLTGNEYGKDFYVDVYVRLNDYLEETIEYYYFNNNGTQVQGFDESTINGSKTGINKKMGEVGFKIDGQNYYTTLSDSTYVGNLTSKIDKDAVGITALKPHKDGGGGIPLERSFNGDKLEGYYSLRDFSDSSKETSLAKLVNLSNKTDNGNLNKIVVNTNSNELKIWSRVVWKTALSDFKSRRFKCDYLGYSQKTGRVCEIYFSEL